MGKKVKAQGRYHPELCQELIDFFDVPPFSVTEVMKKDGSVSLLETAAELPTLAAFAKKIGTTRAVLEQWKIKHPAFAAAIARACDAQGNILLQNALRGNYGASFAIFAAKNLLGWKETKEESSAGPTALRIYWEEKNDPAA